MTPLTTEMSEAEIAHKLGAFIYVLLIASTNCCTLSISLSNKGGKASVGADKKEKSVPHAMPVVLSVD